MTKKNERMNVIRNNFFETYLQEHPEIQEDREIPDNYKTVWKIMIRKAGDDFLYMNEEDMQRFLVTVVARKGLSYLTRYNYFLAYRKILAFMKKGGNITVDFEDWEFNTIFGYNSKNEDSKADNSDNSSNEYIAVLENLLNSKFQEIKKHNQEIESNNQEIESNNQETKKLNQETKRLNQDSKNRKQKVKEINKECLKITAIIDAVNKGQIIIRELPNITREFLSH